MVSIIIFICISFPVTRLFPESEIVFHYAFVIRNDTNAVSLLDTSGTHTRIYPDAHVRILLQPVENACLYLFLHDAEGTLSVLFPERYDTVFEEEKYYDALYSIPGPASWFVPNEKKGTESFYLLVSQTRLTRLESLVQEYLKLAETDADRKKEAAGEIESEITMLRRVHSSFTEKAVSPVVIAGDYRGDNTAGYLPEKMMEVRAGSFYAKTIRLVH